MAALAARIRSAGTTPFDAALATALALGAQLEVWVAQTAPGPRGVSAALSLAMTAALVWRRRIPTALMWGVVAVAALAFLEQPASGDDESFVIIFVLLIAAYGAGAYAGGRRAVIAAAGVAALVAVIVGTDPEPVTGVGDVAFFAILIGGPWVGGLAMRRRRRREGHLEAETVALVEDRDRRAREAVAEERARIARELHDVVAHGVSVIVLQAEGGARLLDTEPETARAAFASIESTGREALSEMRRLLGIFRQDDEAIALAPAPSLAQLPVLAEHVGRAGLPVELTIDGEPRPLPPGVELSAYRIVQEALTNALKHAGPARARVRVHYRGRELEIEVVDDGEGPAEPAGDEGGHGLVGMRERVSVFGGELRAGGRAEGGYAVHVRLPLDTARP